ncbi:hypothetical protein JUNP479_4221 [Aeromonas jandaei]|nr:hypothetical protein JUNP479_4221 [Aeromonas jandaei]
MASASSCHSNTVIPNTVIPNTVIPNTVIPNTIISNTPASGRCVALGRSAGWEGRGKGRLAGGR